MSIYQQATVLTIKSTFTTVRDCTNPGSNNNDGTGVVTQYWTNCSKYVVIAEWITVRF